MTNDNGVSMEDREVIIVEVGDIIDKIVTTQYGTQLYIDKEDVRGFIEMLEVICGE